MSLQDIARSLLTHSSGQGSEPRKGVLKSLTGNPPRKRDVASRVCAALFGGYATASVVSMLLARVMPLPKAEATTSAILLTPILYLAAILWSFSAASPTRAWALLIGLTAIAGSLTYAFILLGGRP